MSSYAIALIVAAQVTSLGSGVIQIPESRNPVPDLPGQGPLDPASAAAAELAHATRAEVYLAVEGPVTVANLIGADDSEPLLVAPAELFDGGWLSPGDDLASNATIMSGAFLTSGPTWIITDYDQFDVGPDTLVIVRPGSGLATPECPNGCSVSCGDGYYSCCFFTSGGCASCLCIQTGSNPPPGGCYSGGVGSTGCAVQKNPGPGG